MIVIQAIRLADLAAARLAYAEGRRGPSPEAINMHELVGDIAADPLDDVDAD